MHPVIVPDVKDGGPSVCGTMPPMGGPRIFIQNISKI